MYFGDTQAVANEMGNLLGSGGMWAANPTMQSLLALLMGQSQNANMPMLDQAATGSLDKLMQQGVEYGGQQINRQQKQTLQDIVALQSSKGTMGSSGHARAQDQMNQNSMQAFSDMMNQAILQRQQSELAMRQALMGNQSQLMLGTGSILNQLLGTQMGGYGQMGSILAQQQQADAQRLAGILGGLGQLGGGAMSFATNQWGRQQPVK